MTYVLSFLKQQPFVLLFIVVGMGFILARLKVFGISPGVVAWTLIFGLLLSLWAVQSANISLALPQILQTVFFNLYIFCVGLRVGPQCFAGLDGNGKKFVAVALAAVMATPVLAVACGWYFHFDAGTLAGLIAGSNTASAAFGAAQSAIQNGAALAASETASTNLSISFAIAYAFSLVGFFVVLPLLPRMTRSDVCAAAQRVENELGGGGAPLPQTPEALHCDYVPVDIRAYRIEKARAVGKSVEVLKQLHPKVTIEGVRRSGRMVPLEGNLVLQLGDEVALGGRVEQQQRILQEVGPEIDEPDLLDFHPETADTVITRE